MEFKPFNTVYEFLKCIPENQLLVILEGFRIAVSDADTYDTLVDKMDLSDEEMYEVRKTVQIFLDMEDEQDDLIYTQTSLDISSDPE